MGGGAADLPCYASLVRYSDPTLVRAAREEAGPDVELMVDVNCDWTPYEARMKAEGLKEIHLKWLQEPIWPPENYDGLAQLRRTCGIAIAAGENVSTHMDFERLITAGAVDFVQPSVAKMGGISEFKKIVSIAGTRNVTLMPHVFYDGPGLLAATDVTAALGTADAMIEWRSFDLEAHIYGALSPTCGRLPVPQGPGLGIEPDPNVIRDYMKAQLHDAAYSRLSPSQGLIRIPGGRHH